MRGTTSAGPIAGCDIRSAGTSGQCMTVETERAYFAMLWRSVDQLLGRGHTSMASSIDVGHAETVNKFFFTKVYV